MNTKGTMLEDDNSNKPFRLPTPGASPLRLKVLQKNHQTCERPSDPGRSRRTRIYFTPKYPAELVFQVLGPRQWVIGLL